MYLESQLPILQRGIESASRPSQDLATKLPNTALISPSFMSRAFAVWGHYFVAQLIIAIPIYIIVFLIAMSGS